MDGESWLTVRASLQPDFVAALRDELDPGEAEAIVLALEINADYLIIDELKGRHKAEMLGLRIVGLLGILVLAKRKGHILKVEPLLIELREIAGFRIHPALYQRIVQMAGESS